MKKKVIFVLIILVITTAIGIAYLNKVVLPVKLKALVTAGLSQATQKKVTLESLRFNLFKGLVLRGLTIYDEKEKLLSLEEASCSFLIPPIFKKNIIIPSIKLKSPVLSLIRNKDGKFNIQDLFNRQSTSEKKLAFGIYIRKVIITEAQVNFRDNSPDEVFTKEFYIPNATVYLSLPASLKFKLLAQLDSEKASLVRLSGEYRLLEKSLVAKASIDNFLIEQFKSYYKSSGIKVGSGLIDAIADIELKDQTFYCDCKILSKDLEINKDKVSFGLSLDSSVILQYSFDKNLNGNIDIKDASIRLKAVDSVIEHIKGKIEFDKETVAWDDLQFAYQGKNYNTKGQLSNFKAPKLDIELDSDDLSFNSALGFKNGLVSISSFNGRYLNSSLSLAGIMNTAQKNALGADLKGKLEFNLDDSGKLLNKFKDKIEKIKPKGIVQVLFKVRGNLNNFKSCFAEADCSADSFSFYGFKANDLSLKITQSEGIIDIPVVHFLLYGGEVQAKAGMNLISNNLPYWIAVDLQGIKLEKLKLDTTAKNKDISGTIKAQAKINGFSKDTSKLSGQGEILVSEGRLWQLNLFKGLGSLLFVKDFSDIVFHEGYCSFLIKDKSIFTDNLKLKSNVTNLLGPVKIGFDGSLAASLNVEVLDEGFPLSGTVRDLTTAIIGQGGSYGTIKISGTLKEPKYKFQAPVADIIKSLKNIIFGE